MGFPGDMITFPAQKDCKVWCEIAEMSYHEYLKPLKTVGHTVVEWCHLMMYTGEGL